MSCTRNGEAINLVTIIDHAILEVTQIACNGTPNFVIRRLQTIEKWWLLQLVLLAASIRKRQKPSRKDVTEIFIHRELPAFHCMQLSVN